LPVLKKNVEKTPEDPNNVSPLSVDVSCFDGVLSEEEIRKIDEIANACFANENATDQHSEEEDINFRELIESLNFDRDLSQPQEGFDFVTDMLKCSKEQ